VLVVVESGCGVAAVVAGSMCSAFSVGNGGCLVSGIFDGVTGMVDCILACVGVVPLLMTCFHLLS
jgi:hypothetical protein